MVKISVTLIRAKEFCRGNPTNSIREVFYLVNIAISSKDIKEYGFLCTLELLKEY